MLKQGNDTVQARVHGMSLGPTPCVRLSSRFCGFLPDAACTHGWARWKGRTESIQSLLEDVNSFGSCKPFIKEDCAILNHSSPNLRIKQKHTHRKATTKSRKPTYMYVYIHVYMYVNVHTYICIYVEVYIYICTYICIHLYIIIGYVHLFTYIHIYIYRYIESRSNITTLLLPMGGLGRRARGGLLR